MSLSAWFISFEIIGAIGTALVIVGLFKEYGWNVFDFLKIWRPRELQFAHVEVETASKQRGSALVVLGISIELIGAVGIFGTSLQIDIEHRREVAQLEQEAANTRLRALRLEKAIAWRVLLVSQAKKLAAGVSAFNGQKVNVFTYMGDLEAWLYADQIGATLGLGHDTHPELPWLAKWDVHFGRIALSPRTASGILVEVTPKATEQDKKAAQALFDALRLVTPHVTGVSVRGDALKGEQVYGDTDPSANICLTVAVHPPPPIELEIEGQP